MVPESKVNRKINWQWLAAGVVASCAFIFYLAKFFSGYVPLSSLPVEEMPEIGGMRSVCNGPRLFPLSLETPNWQFPINSPNGQYYADLGESSYRRSKELRLYEAGTDRLLGTYSYKELFIYCWAEDSSGVYIADWDPGSGSILFANIGDRAPYYGQVKKVLIRK